jgi:Ni,Fe-hydrogenase III large subunit/Ni,Fe-hydrogenase III small subunit/formate hydrogenlyase subunit 6/NADH:ubiquinone oxidoreductase subunit I
MFETLRQSLKTGVVTTSYPETPAEISSRARGRPEIDWAHWKDARPATAICPTGAITSRDEQATRTATLDLGKCIFCGLCADVDPAIRMTNRCELAARQRASLTLTARYHLNADGTHEALLASPSPVTGEADNLSASSGSEKGRSSRPGDMEALGEQLRERTRSVLGRSLHIREVDAGSCNGCEVEIHGLNSPVYDLERFGIHFVASPRHADMLLVTGPVTRNMELALKKTYDATPEPRLVVAVGACGCSGGIFGVNYATAAVWTPCSGERLHSRLPAQSTRAAPWNSVGDRAAEGAARQTFMKTPAQFAFMSNATSLPWAAVPESPVEALVNATAEELKRGGRLCAWFGVPEAARTRLVAVLAFDADNTLVVGRSEPVSGRYPALTLRHAQAHLFEREVWEQHGLVPEGHPWLKPVRRNQGGAPAAGKFFQVDGHEVHEVAVGPVHAGVIEPGHFRFQCHGEAVLLLEIALGYQHRGAEEALTGGPHPGTMSQVETVAGDTTMGHATAYAMILETLAGTEIPLRAQWLRALALELERLANHTGDLGALANDVAFLPTSAACGKTRGDFLNLTALLCGNRFGRGLVRPGGCRHDLEPQRARQLLERLGSAQSEVEEAAAWLWDANSVRSRFEGTGPLSAEQAAEMGLVGVAARASGLVRDVRFDHPAGWHRFAQVPVAVWPGGDVFARAGKVAGDSTLRQIPRGTTGDSAGRRDSRHDRAIRGRHAGGGSGGKLAGEVCHVALTDETGHFRRYKIVDPSFHNGPD